ncbi:MAG: lysoplasmalogenase [Leptonema sp. (in: Bacteria)]|nr:lysoplasmalogenase [Leptonema sp. (in: bacteria)]
MQSRKTLLTIAAIDGLVYILLDSFLLENSMHGTWWGAIIKTIPIWIFFYLVLTTVKTTEGKLVATGILFGSGGDVLLALGLFVPGLVSFLIGHLFFIPAWLRRFQFRNDRLAFSVAVLILAVGLGIWLSPSLGGFAIPVYAYVAVISIMSALSFLRTRNSWVLPIGTVLFVVSDAIIAINKFHTPVVLAGVLVMGTYYAAQACIALGFIGEQSES